MLWVLQPIPDSGAPTATTTTTTTTATPTTTTTTTTTATATATATATNTNTNTNANANTVLFMNTILDQLEHVGTISKNSGELSLYGYLEYHFCCQVVLLYAFDKTGLVLRPRPRKNISVALKFLLIFLSKSNKSWRIQK